MSNDERTPNFSIRELTNPDIDLIADYWATIDPDDIRRMGVDPKRMFSVEEFAQMMRKQLKLPLEDRRSFCTIWLVDDQPIGHCNTNPTTYGIEAMFHLHIWQKRHRKAGFGQHLLPLSLGRFFDQLKLSRVIAEPYHANDAPNRLLKKLGFTLEKEYETVPGQINLEQVVKRWTLTREKFNKLNSGNR